MISGTDARAVEAFKETQQLMIFWQELFFREERSQLPFMEKAREKERREKRNGIPIDAFDRVGGLLFLDMSFAPDSNKTIISKSGDMRMELFDRESFSSNSREYQRLQDEFHSKVKAWHEEFDRMVMFFTFFLSDFNQDECSNLDVFQDSFEGPYKEIRRGGVEMLIWRSVTKRQETSRARRTAARSSIEDVKYQARWDGKPGDVVEVFHPDDRRSRVVGHIEYLCTSKVDGLYPCHGQVVLVRPFEGVEVEYDSASIVRKVEANEWKKMLRQIQERLPNVLQVFHQYRDANDNIVRAEIFKDSVYRLDAELIPKNGTQISVDVLDETGNRLIDNDRDKLRVLLVKELVVKLELFNSNGDPMRDPKSKRSWVELLRPYNPKESSQFNTGEGTKQFTSLWTMLAQQLPKNSRTFRLDISLVLDSRLPDDAAHPFRTDLVNRIEAIKCSRDFEISAGENLH